MYQINLFLEDSIPTKIRCLSSALAFVKRSERTSFPGPESRSAQQENNLALLRAVSRTVAQTVETLLLLQFLVKHPFLLGALGILEGTEYWERATRRSDGAESRKSFAIRNLLEEEAFTLALMASVLAFAGRFFVAKNGFTTSGALQAKWGQRPFKVSGGYETSSSNDFCAYVAETLARDCPVLFGRLEYETAIFRSSIEDADWDSSLGMRDVITGIGTSLGMRTSLRTAGFFNAKREFDEGGIPISMATESRRLGSSSSVSSPAAGQSNFPFESALERIRNNSRSPAYHKSKTSSDLNLIGGAATGSANSLVLACGSSFSNAGADPYLPGSIPKNSTTSSVARQLVASTHVTFWTTACGPISWRMPAANLSIVRLALERSKTFSITKTVENASSLTQS